MEWFSWLSKTGLDLSLVYEYAQAFTQNELEEEDISYFNHEFLQSMGVSIAKHRLEILKLAWKERRSSSRPLPRPISRLLLAINRTRSRVAKYFQELIWREKSALVVVPRPQPSYNNNTNTRWKNSMLKKDRKLSLPIKQGRLLLTNGSPKKAATTRFDNFNSPLVYALGKVDKIDGDDNKGYWTTSVEDIRWDTMFQDLKPT